MASIDVTINWAFGNITDGRITATPNESFIDGNDNLVLKGIAYPSVTIASGTASIIIPSTEDFGVSYHIVIESGTDPYTLVEEYDVVLDNVTPQNGNNFLTNFFSKDLLDTSIQSIANLLTIVPYIDRLAARIPGFSFKAYTAGETFIKNDVTFFSNRLWQWRSNVSGNSDPTTSYTDPGNLLDGTIDANADWLVMSGSLVGSGVTTTNVAYNHATFQGLTTEPASRTNLTELDDLLRNDFANDLTGYALKAQTNTFTVPQIFGADITVPDVPNTEDSGKVANTRIVRQIIDSYASFANLSNRLSIVEERYNEGTNVSLNAGINTRNLNTIHVNGGDILSLNANVINLAAGTYLVWASAMCNRCDGSKLFLFNEDTQGLVSSRSSSGYSGSNLGNLNQSSSIENFLIDVFTIGSPLNVTLRHNLQVGGATAGGVGSNLNGYSELFSRVVFFKLFS